MKSYEAYSIHEVISNNNGQGIVVTKSGSICLSYLMIEPECYNLSPEDIDERINIMKNAFRRMPENSYLHKQDIYLKNHFHRSLGESYLDKADTRHFDGRLYMDHKCVIHFVLSNLSTLDKSYYKSLTSYRASLHRQDEESLTTFLESVSDAIGILKTLRHTELYPLNTEEMSKLIYSYANMFSDSNSIQDVKIDSSLHIGCTEAKYISICDESFFPDTDINSYVKDDSLPMANSDLYRPLMESLGIYLPYNHIINQVIYFEGNQKLKTAIEKNIEIYGSNSSMSKDIKHQFEKLSEAFNDALEDNEIFVRSNFSLCIFSDNDKELTNGEKKIKEILNINQFKYYIPSYNNLAEIHFSSVPGQISLLSKKFMYLCPLPIALCLFLHCSTFRNDDEGIYVHDRMYQVPLRKDIWDAKKKRINARNGMIIAGTGGGKSAFTLNFTQQLIEQDYTCIVVEFGKSFSQLCKLYPNISLHVDYDGKTALGINPFDLQGGELTNNDLEMLSEIIQRYWKHMFTNEESENEVALTRIIQDYYENITSGHNFESFYHFVVDNFNDILIRKHISKKYFDLESFQLNCGEFLPGQRYENVCKDIQLDFGSKKFIVFELTQIKQDKFLSNLVMSMIFTIIQKKLLSDRRKRGILIFDEYAETAQMKDSTTGIGIHSSVAFCYQKIRKENGAVYTIVQTPEQLPDDEFTKNIISNTDLLFVLPTKEVIYNSIIDKFQITRANQQALMKSLRNNFSCEHPYSECFIRMGENYATVTRLEFSKEKFLAFQTEGEIWSDLEEKATHMSMEEAITQYIIEHTKK